MKVMILSHVTIIGVYRVVSVDVYVLLNLTFSLVTLINTGDGQVHHRCHVMLDDIDKGFCLFAMQISSNMAKIALPFESYGCGCTSPIN